MAFDRGLIGRLFVAASDKLRCGDRRGLRVTAHHFEHEDTVENLTGWRVDIMLLPIVLFDGNRGAA